MSYDCYFCATKLIYFKNYGTYYVCRHCPELDSAVGNSPVWKYPCFVIMDDDKINATSVYVCLRELNVWVVHRELPSAQG